MSLVEHCGGHVVGPELSVRLVANVLYTCRVGNVRVRVLSPHQDFHSFLPR